MPVSIRAVLPSGLRCLTIAAVLAVCAAAPAKAAEQITVVLDEAKVLLLPPNTSTIILGNPAIADVSMLKRNNQMILTGKSFGRTNLIALDVDGKSVGESTVVVINPAGGGGLVVQRGLQRETYNCSPICNPTVTLGDDSKFMAEASGQAQQRLSTASPGGKK
ncbi:pilus assembly protein N-terminal domain-containing protein [Methylocella sp. CPCC 101449]|jgi:Flp pilus assembly secretin CpaC|uniref:pilus assembly protein N-terminal domain-containing protein n=1 Tax=Methylocella sp. CPCC 101449 TaxID=2987531 RepID=UPI00289285B0|nr:pilus assembly protein N-terminal domain-containing protein [Methylocella sp. CPCC 101449]MDT2019269.1 pilus assembly protein N-terminal domain-containing protein [Methylocella sp. CPCC 101449]HEV2573332.1 pilus assembly protein N-terminal domain-containing protein [Beijerinckiaceae bacterium]